MENESTELIKFLEPQYKTSRTLGQKEKESKEDEEVFSWMREKMSKEKEKQEACHGKK